MKELEPEFQRFKDAKITGKRLFNEVTFNPSSANPGESIYVNPPNLGENMCLVPNSLFLTAKFKSKNTKSWFLDNPGKLLVQELSLGKINTFMSIPEKVCMPYTATYGYQATKEPIWRTWV